MQKTSGKAAIGSQQILTASACAGPQTVRLFALGCCRPHPVLMGDPVFRSVTAALLVDAAGHRQVTVSVKYFDQLANVTYFFVIFTLYLLPR